ncbi:hypothetical protein BKA62DRAFT_673717 [Auriculariales sp. MPI-PUGE-AT-0066]|nr:hypothetical protein BKA62DRAFT_673717 [Auriculariales sp. MPI-PUGE-AT-0066]
MYLNCSGTTIFICVNAGLATAATTANSVKAAKDIVNPSKKYDSERNHRPSKSEYTALRDCQDNSATEDYGMTLAGIIQLHIAHASVIARQLAKWDRVVSWRESFSDCIVFVPIQRLAKLGSEITTDTVMICSTKYVFLGNKAVIASDQTPNLSARTK